MMKLLLLLGMLYLVIGCLVVLAIGCIAGAIEVRKSKKWWRENLTSDLRGFWDEGGFGFFFTVVLWPVAVVALACIGISKAVYSFTMRMIVRFAEWWEREMWGGEP